MTLALTPRISNSTDDKVPVNLSTTLGVMIASQGGSQCQNNSGHYYDQGMVKLICIRTSIDIIKFQQNMYLNRHEGKIECNINVLVAKSYHLYMYISVTEFFFNDSY